MAPMRRASRARRTTGSPRKRSPVKKAAGGTPAKKARTTTVKTPVGKKGKKEVVEEKENDDGEISSDYDTRKISGVTPVVPKVLGERVGQDSGKGEDGEEDEEEIPVTKPKRKR